MKSHCSNVRLGPLLQLTGFTHQEKEASLFSAQIRLETLDTTLKGIPTIGGKPRDKAIIGNLRLLLSLWGYWLWRAEVYLTYS